jgi:hypothetical protein
MDAVPEDWVIGCGTTWRLKVSLWCSDVRLALMDKRQELNESIGSKISLTPRWWNSIKTGMMSWCLIVVHETLLDGETSGVSGPVIHWYWNCHLAEHFAHVIRGRTIRPSGSFVFSPTDKEQEINWNFNFIVAPSVNGVSYTSCSCQWRWCWHRSLLPAGCNVSFITSGIYKYRVNVYYDNYDIFLILQFRVVPWLAMVHEFDCDASSILSLTNTIWFAAHTLIEGATQQKLIFNREL